MDEQNIRLECLRLAVSHCCAPSYGENVPPAVEVAQKFYNFVKGSLPAPEKTLKAA